MSTLLYTKEDYDRDISRLVGQLRDKQFDLIVGVSRGGCIPAVCLSHALQLPATMIDYSTRDGANINPESVYQLFSALSQHYGRILVVDDLVDSGKSLKQLLATVDIFSTPAAATLLHNTDVDIGFEHYYGTAYSRKTEPRFIDFWWEQYGV